MQTADQGNERKSAFVSYAHRDAWDFTRRLVFSLGMYADVFWDRRLPAGPFPPQLETEIESRGFFLFVMTPSSLDSPWCKQELEHAMQCKPVKIIPVRIFPECIHEGLKQGEYNYADFSEDFDQGFRALTQMMLGQPVSSWELLGYQKDSDVIACIERGLLPGLISKTLAEWVIVEKVWVSVEQYIDTRQKSLIFRGGPRTAIGVLRHCKSLENQFTDNRNNVGYSVVKDAEKVAEIYGNSFFRLSDNRHSEIGLKTAEVIRGAKTFLESQAQRERSAFKLAQVQGYFDFDIAEKARELIDSYARRSRYLY